MINIEIRKLTKDNLIQIQYNIINEDKNYGRFSKLARATLRTFTKSANRQSSIIEDNQGKPLADENPL